MILAQYEELKSRGFKFTSGSKAFPIACLQRNGMTIIMEQTRGAEYALHFAKDTKLRSYDEEGINSGALDHIESLDSLIEFLQNPNS